MERTQTETRVYSLKKTAKVLELCEATVRRMLKDGRINGFKIGKVWRIDQAEMDRLTARGTNGKE